MQTTSSNPTLSRQTVTHADIQKYIPGISSETITKLEKIALQNRAKLIALHGPNFLDVITTHPLPKPIRSKAVSILETEPAKSERCGTCSPFIRPYHTQRPSGADLERREPTQFLHLSK